MLRRMKISCWVMFTGVLLAAIPVIAEEPAKAQPTGKRAPEPQSAPQTQPVGLSPLESKYLANLRLVTEGLPRAGEGYFSPDGKSIIYQAFPIGYPFYQIYLQKLDEKTPRLISTGRGRTTCSYFSPDGKTLLFASSHSDPEIAETEKKARAEAAQGGRRRYQWDFDPHMDLYTVNLDGTGMKRLTDTPGYDAEGSYSSDGKQIVFTSSRDGDPDLYIMNADGTGVRQLTNSKGYDGGPFFSPDQKWVIFRSDRDKEHMLQLFAISVDGKTEVQLTKNLDQVNWCPYFHPTGKYLIWAGADYSKGPATAKFHLFTMELSYPDGMLKGGEVTQITDSDVTDILPVFSPDGKKLMWTSTRSADKSSQLWIADWLREVKP
ncbi:MAG: domain protein beta Propeller [Planctomycetaceae bacterium]|nr:domain protein beta Propeller [Planctomycetaceae bacterium]